MARTRWTGTVAGLPVNLLREDLDGAAPPAPPSDDGGTQPPPPPPPSDGGGTEPPPPADGGGTDDGGAPAPPSAVIYRYREPTRLKFFDQLDKERDENGLITIGYSGDREQDGTTDQVKIKAGFGTGKKIACKISEIDRWLYGGAKPGDVIELTGGSGFFPGGEWRVTVPDLTVVGEPGAVYEFQKGNLPGAKGLPLGMSELDGAFRWQGQDCHVKGAVLPDNAGHNGAFIRQTRCPYTLIENTTVWNCQDGILGDGSYKGVVCQRIELNGVRFHGSGTSYGKEHSVYIAKTCRQFLARDSYFGGVTEGHDIQFRGWEMYLFRCQADDEGSTKSYFASLPNGTVALVEECEAHFRPGRSQDMAIGIGQVADAVDRQPEVGLTLLNNRFIDHGSKIKGIVRAAGWIKPEWIKSVNSDLVQAA